MKNGIKKLIFTLISLMTISHHSYAGNRPLEGNVIIFISFSMPKESIKGWINEGKKIHAPVIIRGLVNNSFKDTVSKLTELMSDNQGGVQLDPVLFNEYNIKQVPAVVVKNNNQYDVVYGDVHLDYALQSIIKRNDELTSVAGMALRNLRGN